MTIVSIVIERYSNTTWSVFESLFDVPVVTISCYGAK